MEEKEKTIENIIDLIKAFREEDINVIDSGMTESQKHHDYLSGRIDGYNKIIEYIK